MLLLIVQRCIFITLTHPQVPGVLEVPFFQTIPVIVTPLQVELEHKSQQALGLPLPSWVPPVVANVRMLDT